MRFIRPGGTCSRELTEAHRKLAAELGVVIVASGFEKRATGLYHNTAWVVDADGSFLGMYRKMHIRRIPGLKKNSTSPPATWAIRRSTP